MSFQILLHRQTAETGSGSDSRFIRQSNKLITELKITADLTIKNLNLHLYFVLFSLKI